MYFFISVKGGGPFQPQPAGCWTDVGDVGWRLNVRERDVCAGEEEEAKEKKTDAKSMEHA